MSNRKLPMSNPQPTKIPWLQSVKKRKKETSVSNYQVRHKMTSVAGQNIVADANMSDIIVVMLCFVNIIT